MARNNTDSNADDPLLAAFRLFYEAIMAAVPAAAPGLSGADSPTVTPEASSAATTLQHQLVQVQSKQQQLPVKQILVVLLQYYSN